MRSSEMEIGKQYVMQRGPTHKPRKVTLLKKDAPSGASHRVLVRVEEGITAGKELETPSQSIYHAPGREHATHRRSTRTRNRRIPDGWTPSVGDAVAWSRTLGSRCTVLGADAVKGTVLLKATVMGMQEEFMALITDLSPYRTELTPVPDKDEVDELLNARLPVPGHVSTEPKSDTRLLDVAEGDGNESLVDRLVFSPGCISFYRKRFASGVSLQEAANRLRGELRGAQMLRKSHTGEYLRLRVLGQFDAVLMQSPSSAGFQALYVKRLQLPAKSKRKKRRKAA